MNTVSLFRFTKVLRQRFAILLSIGFLSSCGGLLEQVSEQSAYLGTSYSLTFTGSSDHNLLAKTSDDLENKRGCKFEPGTELSVVKIFESSSNENQMYVFLYGTIGECSMRHGLVDKRSLTSLPRSAKTHHALKVTEATSTKVFTKKGSHNLCTLNPGDVVLSSSEPVAVDERYLKLNVVSNKLGFLESIYLQQGLRQKHLQVALLPNLTER
jgi:hypothetical protein